MNKITIFSLPLILLSVASCVKEKEFSIFGNSSSNKIEGIVVDNGGLDTKCSTESQGNVLISDMPYVTQSGDTLYISAFLSDMDEPEPVETKTDTKGAPITSALFGTYGDFNAFNTRVYTANSTSCYVSKRNSAGDESRTMSDVTVSYSSGKWAFDNAYYWPQNNDDYLYFISIAPKIAWTNNFVYNRDLTTCWNTTTHKYSFSYSTLPDTLSGENNGMEQYDLLLAYNKQRKDTYDKNVHIDFKHACVGVRFIMGDIFGCIGNMKLQNFYKDATITVGEGGSIEYSNHSKLYTFTQSFDFETTTHNDKDPLDETTNKDKTFMVLPQKLINRGGDTPDADLVIFMGNTLHPETLSFSELADPSKGGDAKLADWSGYAGKIITFRVSSAKANNVSVFVDDEVVGHTKKNIVITNDGRSDIMIRMKLVGNWLNADGEVLASWHESNPYGIFDADNGFPDNLNDVNWKLGSDGFYYYRKYLKTGKTVSENLFKSFEVKYKPVDATGTWAQGGTKMEIKTMELALLVQAIIAEPTLDSFKAAWGTELVSWIGTPVSDE